MYVCKIYTSKHTKFIFFKNHSKNWWTCGSQKQNSFYKNDYVLCYSTSSGTVLGTH